MLFSLELLYYEGVNCTVLRTYFPHSLQRMLWLLLTQPAYTAINSVEDTAMEKSWYEHIPGVQTEEALIHKVMDEHASGSERAKAGVALGTEAVGALALAAGALSYAYVPEVRFAANNAIAKVTDIPLPRYIDPGARVAEGAIIEPGAVIMKDAVVGNRVVIGRNALLAPNSNVDWLSRIGSGTRIGVNTSVQSFSEIGDNVRIAENTLIGSYAKIGSHAEVGAGNTINAYATLGERSVIGEHNLIDSKFTLGADAELGSHNVINWTVKIGDGSTVGNYNTLGDWTEIANSRVGDANLTSRWVGIHGVDDFGDNHSLVDHEIAQPASV
ncbi:MAG TPA: hypothetical protein V6C81_30745 [Planktothrix sp.]|jgi:UDP-3-O-[3-hydroxymyristoyl] glucosamine N-acyltransferase